MSDESTFVVVPFQRLGTYVGARQMLVLKDQSEARALLHRLTGRFPGVALIERHVDEETGDDVERLIQAHGAVPGNLMQVASWRMALH